MYDSLSEFILDVAALECCVKWSNSLFISKLSYPKSKVVFLESIISTSTFNVNSSVLSFLVVAGGYSNTSLLHKDTANLEIVKLNLKCRNTSYELSDTVDLRKDTTSFTPVGKINSCKLISVLVNPNRITSLTRKLMLVNYLHEMNKPLQIPEVTTRLQTISNYLQQKGN